MELVGFKILWVNRWMTIPSHIYIIYGSTEGHSEKVAHTLHDKLPISSSHKSLLNLNDFRLSECQDTEARLIFLISTTGDGEFPENAVLGWKRLREFSRNMSSKISQIEYRVCGFGDSNYRNFCHSSKCLYRLLQRVFVNQGDLTLIDDAIDDDTKINQWITSIVSWIKQLEYNRRWSWITRFI